MTNQTRWMVDDLHVPHARAKSVAKYLMQFLLSWS